MKSCNLGRGRKRSFSIVLSSPIAKLKAASAFDRVLTELRCKRTTLSLLETSLTHQIESPRSTFRQPRSNQLTEILDISMRKQGFSHWGISVFSVTVLLSISVVKSY
jgi:hypothetical protein